MPYSLIAEDPETHLGPWLDAERGSKPPARLTTEEAIQGWQSRLLSDDDALAYLIDKRELTVETVTKYELGWDGDGNVYTLPVRERGEIVNLLRRRPGPKQPWVVSRGRGSQLFPEPRPGAVLLLAGIFDVLSARQAGLDYAVSTTCGASLPRHLVPALARRIVAVAYDVGEEAAAERTVAKLRAAGSEAWVVRLAELGLPPGGDLNDFYCAGGTTDELVRLVKASRDSA